MNKRALYYALAYSALFIGFKLFIVLGNNSLNSFGFNFSHVIAMFMILPFYMLAIKAERDNVQGGIISGREALRIALTVFAVSALIISVYHYIEFETWIKHMAPRYYTSDEYMQFLKRQTKVKPEQFPRIIATQIAAAERGAFVATSVKLFGFLLIAVPSALLATLVMKRRKKSAQLT